jgi:hypothetical protein
MIKVHRYKKFWNKLENKIISLGYKFEDLTTDFTCVNNTDELMVQFYLSYKDAIYTEEYCTFFNTDIVGKCKVYILGEKYDTTVKRFIKYLIDIKTLTDTLIKENQYQCEKGK